MERLDRTSRSDSWKFGCVARASDKHVLAEIFGQEKEVCERVETRALCSWRVIYWRVWCRRVTSFSNHGQGVCALVCLCAMWGARRRGSCRAPQGQGRFCPSIDVVCKVEKSGLENSSVSFRRSTFRVSFHGFMQKRTRNNSIPPKLSVANSFNNEGKFDCWFFKVWVSCRFSNKRNLWKTMHRQTKCCKLSRSTDRNDPHDQTPGEFFIIFSREICPFIHFFFKISSCESRNSIKTPLATYLRMCSSDVCRKSRFAQIAAAATWGKKMRMKFQKSTCGWRNSTTAHTKQK